MSDIMRSRLEAIGWHRRSTGPFIIAEEVQTKKLRIPSEMLRQQLTNDVTPGQYCIGTARWGCPG